MAVGKTTVGRALSLKLGCAFWDLDEAIVTRQGRSISDIFAQEGEAGFRTYETAMLRVLAQNEGILSLGGGTVSQPGNLELLAGWPVIVLMAPWEHLSPRLSIPGRPNAPRAQSLYQARQEDWKRAGPWVDARQPIEAILQQIVTLTQTPELCRPTG